MTKKIYRSEDYCGLFRVGDICIGQRFVDAASEKYNDMECEIIGPLKPYKVRETTTYKNNEVVGYSVRWENGDEKIISSYNLAPHRLGDRLPIKSTWALFKHVNGFDPRIPPNRWPYNVKQKGGQQ